jgi:hypothetical protein
MESRSESINEGDGQECPSYGFLSDLDTYHLKPDTSSPMSKPNPYFHLDDLTRRQLMRSLAQSCLGVTVLPLAWQMASAADPKKTELKKPDAKAPAARPANIKTAKHIIYLYMQGAMSQLDTFDPKPGASVQGETKPVATALPGVQFSEYLPGLAKLAGKLAVIRSMTTTTADHTQARYLANTSFKPIASTQHPGFGSWVHKELGGLHKDLPVAVQIGGGIGPGYLGAKYAPVPIGDPALGLQNTKSPAYMTDSTFDKRMELSGAFDQNFRKKAEKNAKVTGYDDLYRDAIHLLRSEDLKAFDISHEKDDAKKAYGDTRLGKGCLLARRLVESGVRYVEVAYGSWDHHYELWDKMPTQAGGLDQVASALLTDLEQRGLLKDTVVVIGTEFGRQPEINSNTGRDHHPAVYSCVLAGGPIQGGQVYGKSDEKAFRVDTDGVSPEDFNATLATAVGIDPNKEIHSPDGRPFTLGNHGKVLTKLV